MERRKIKTGDGKEKKVNAGEKTSAGRIKGQEEDMKREQGTGRE